jgi:hypothetical protein
VLGEPITAGEPTGSPGDWCWPAALPNIMGKGFSSSIGWLHTYSACPTEMRRQLVSKWTELVESACLAGARARPFYGIKVWDSIFNDIFSQKKVYSTKHIILVIIITRRLCHIMWPSKWQNLPSQTLMCRRSGWSWGHSVFQGAGNKGESTKFPSSQALRNMKCPPQRWAPLSPFCCVMCRQWASLVGGDAHYPA